MTVLLVLITIIYRRLKVNEPTKMLAREIHLGLASALY